MLQTHAYKFERAERRAATHQTSTKIQCSNYEWAYSKKIEEDDEM